MPTTTISVRLSDEDLATVCTVANTKKINKSKALKHIIHAYATTQNNTPFELIQNQVLELRKLIEANNYRMTKNINKAIVSANISKYISLYNFADRSDPEIAKNYLSAAEKRAREE